MASGWKMKMADHKMNSKKMEQEQIGAKRPHPSSDHSIDVALAKFFFSCNIPFNVVESKLFRKFVNLLNPNYKVQRERNSQINC